LNGINNEEFKCFNNNNLKNLKKSLNNIEDNNNLIKNKIKRDVRTFRENND